MSYMEPGQEFVDIGNGSTLGFDPTETDIRGILDSFEQKGAACSVALGALGSRVTVKPENKSKIADNPSEEWMIEAKCRGVGPSAFYPSDGVGVEMAKRVCQGCVVKNECLDFAIQNKEVFGVWGEASERERKRISRQRREA